jgi:hypothetical protein
MQLEKDPCQGAASAVPKQDQQGRALTHERRGGQTSGATRNRISEFTGTPEGDALTRIFFKLHH